MSNSRRSRFPIIVNAVIGGLFGLPFGLTSGSPLPWIAGGVLIGALIGVVSESFFNRLRGRRRLYRIRLFFVVLLEALLTLFLVTPIFAAYTTVHPARFPVAISPADLDLPYENVTLETQDGLTLYGWYIPSRNGAAIIAVHGFNGNRTHVIYHAQALAQHGYGVLMFDMRGHGESDGLYAAGWTSDLDVLAAVEYLEGRAEIAPKRIGALGLSAGAHAILYGAARTDRIRALWVDGAGTGRVEDALDPFLPEIQHLWFMTPMPWLTDRLVELFSHTAAAPPLKETVTRIAPRPMMFVAAGQAQYEISLARRYAASAGSSAQVWELPAADHVGGIITYPEEYARHMIDFFDAALADGS